MKNQKMILFSMLLILAAFVAVLSRTLQVRGVSEKGRKTVLSVTDTPDEISFFPTEIQTILLETAPTPSPSPQPEQPERSVDILSGGREVLSVSDENTAKTLLSRYLRSFQDMREEEVFLSSGFGTEVTIRRAEGRAPYLLFDDAYETLMNAPDLIPVITETMCISWSDTPFTLSSVTTNGHIYRKERKIVQFGTEGRNIYSVIRTYAGHEQFSSAEPDLVHVFPKRDTMIENGNARNASGPKKGEKIETEGFSLLLPLNGKTVRPYGEEEASFHGGIDLSGENGTDVICPADGVVVFLANRGSYGYTVDIDHGNGFLSRLTHLNGTDLLMSQRIFAGEMISSLREDDFSSEDPVHLHYELFYRGARVDPSPYFVKK